jgi:hypothetical protein
MSDRPERTAADVHAALCALVSSRAVEHSAWAEYSTVLFGSETAAFFAARLPGTNKTAADLAEQSKKRKRREGSDTAEGVAVAAPVCERCGNIIVQVSLRVACLDGFALDLTVLQRELVSEVKRVVGQARDVNPGLIDLFVEGTEDPLPDAGRLEELGLGDRSVLFMLQRESWCWTQCGGSVTLSADGLVATKDTAGRQLTTGGPLMTEGRHYWEVEVPWAGTVCLAYAMLGAVRPGLDHDKCYNTSNDAYYIDGGSGGLFGNGKLRAEATGKFAKADRVGVLLDLDAGWMRFYRNGQRWGAGFTEGVTGPLVRAAEFYNKGDKATALPCAVAPESEDDGKDEDEGDDCRYVSTEPEPVVYVVS